MQINIAGPSDLDDKLLLWLPSKVGRVILRGIDMWQLVFQDYQAIWPHISHVDLSDLFSCRKVSLAAADRLLSASATILATNRAASNSSGASCYPRVCISCASMSIMPAILAHSSQQGCVHRCPACVTILSCIMLELSYFETHILCRILRYLDHRCP